MTMTGEQPNGTPTNAPSMTPAREAQVRLYLRQLYTLVHPAVYTLSLHGVACGATGIVIFVYALSGKWNPFMVVNVVGFLLNAGLLVAQTRRVLRVLRKLALIDKE